MKKAAAFLLLLLAAAGLAAQEGRLQVAAPFVSRLKARAGENSVELSWRSSPDVPEPCRIYRHSQAIDEKSFPQATEVAVVPAGTAVYRDYPDAGQDWYYAVLLENGRGGLHKLFIPYRNITSAPVRVVRPAPEADLAGRVSGLSATVVGDSVRLSFEVSQGDRELLMFRSLHPMRSLEDLLAASAPAALKAGARSAVDYPIPGIGYYYAVLDAGLFKIGKPELAAGVNSTTVAVEIPIRAASPPAAKPSPAAVPEAAPRTGPAAAAPEAGPEISPETGPEAAPAAAGPTETISIAGAAAPAAAAAAAAPAAPRSSALPYLALGAETAAGLSSVPVGIPPASSRPLKPETEKALAAMLAEAPERTAPVLKPQLLPPERAPEAGSEASGLAAILTEDLLKNDLEAAASRLAAFLSVRRSAEAAARAHFYLGQIYYLQNRFAEASLELLLARDLYYAAVEPWLDASLLALKASRER